MNPNLYCSYVKLRQKKNAYEFPFLFVISCFLSFEQTFHVFWFEQAWYDEANIMYLMLNSNFMIKVQQLSLRNGAVRKLLGLPYIRAQVGSRAEKSPLEGSKTMQVQPSTLHVLVICIMCNWIMMLHTPHSHTTNPTTHSPSPQYKTLRNALLFFPSFILFSHMNLQRSLLEDADLQKELTPSDNGTAIESTTSNFVLESMEENISMSSSPEELLEVRIFTFFFILECHSWMNSEPYTYMFIISKHYSIWELVGEIKLFHWSGKFVLRFVCSLVGYHLHLQTREVEQCYPQDSSREKPRSVYSVDWNGTNPVLKQIVSWSLRMF